MSAAARRRSGEPPLFPLRVLLFAASVPVRLRLVRLRDLATALEPRVATMAHGEDAAALARRIDALLAAGWPLVRRGCLVRGLTLYRFLRHDGMPVALCFGVDTRGNGHCWIEHRGAPLAERADPRRTFVETWRIEGARTP